MVQYGKMKEIKQKNKDKKTVENLSLVLHDIAKEYNSKDVEDFANELSNHGEKIESTHYTAKLNLIISIFVGLLVGLTFFIFDKLYDKASTAWNSCGEWFMIGFALILLTVLGITYFYVINKK